MNGNQTNDLSLQRNNKSETKPRASANLNEHSRAKRYQNSGQSRADRLVVARQKTHVKN